MTEQPQIHLARHFEVFIEDQIMQRKYETPTEVIEDALRLLEAREARNDALRRALIKGEQSGTPTLFDMNGWLNEQEALDARS